MLEENQILDIWGPVEDLSKGIIKVIGVGGGGCNAVRNMYNEGVNGVTYAVCNTDSQSLSGSPVDVKILLGESGLGAGANPELGKKEAESNIDDIRRLLSDNTQMVFITAGMGGGTGTGAAPVIAGVAKEMGHFWWNKAPIFSWEDWLNEGFAEFSMLWYIKCHFSRHIFDCYLEACRENARHACPIYEVDRDAPEAYDALYNKGALLLYDLSQKVAEEKFFGFMQDVAEREITSTEQLLKYAEDTLGRDVKDWIENRIKS